MNPNANEISLTVGRSIKFWRKIEGLNQKELSEKLNASRCYVAKAETGHVGVSLKRIVELSEILGVSYRTLLTYPGKKHKDSLMDLYADHGLRMKKEELEQLWCQNMFTGKEATIAHLKKYLELLRRHPAYLFRTIYTFDTINNKNKPSKKRGSKLKSSIKMKNEPYDKTSVNNLLLDLKKRLEPHTVNVDLEKTSGRSIIKILTEVVNDLSKQLDDIRKETELLASD